LTVSRVLDFFREEARTCLDGMRAVLAASTEQSVDAEILYRHARRLRGSAQMARQAEIQTLAAELEGAARKLAGADVAWSARVREAVNARVNRLATMVDEAVVAVPEQPEGEANVSTEVHA
ncbi:MAG: hypothetical protein GWN71_13830, partial [Gammaproteobacteria bacterium]|nr:hypothetical protein [Gammaproteobacteria bacterium]